MSGLSLDGDGRLRVSRSRSPRAAIATRATPPHLLPRTQDAERSLRPAPRWQRVTHPIMNVPPQWRTPTEDAPHG